MHAHWSPKQARRFLAHCSTVHLNSFFFFPWKGHLSISSISLLDISSLYQSDMAGIFARNAVSALRVRQSVSFFVIASLLDFLGGFGSLSCERYSFWICLRFRRWILSKVQVGAAASVQAWNGRSPSFGSRPFSSFKGMLISSAIFLIWVLLSYALQDVSFRVHQINIACNKLTEFIRSISP